MLMQNVGYQFDWNTLTNQFDWNTRLQYENIIKYFFVCQWTYVSSFVCAYESLETTLNKCSKVLTIAYSSWRLFNTLRLFILYPLNCWISKNTWLKANGVGSIQYKFV